MSQPFTISSWAHKCSCFSNW